MIGSGARDRKEVDGGRGVSQQEHFQGDCMQGRRDSWWGGANSQDADDENLETSIKGFSFLSERETSEL